MRYYTARELYDALLYGNMLVTLVVTPPQRRSPGRAYIHMMYVHILVVEAEATDVWEQRVRRHSVRTSDTDARKLDENGMR